jgi:hypothetical protein
MYLPYLLKVGSKEVEARPAAVIRETQPECHWARGSDGQGTHQYQWLMVR